MIESTTSSRDLFVRVRKTARIYANACFHNPPLLATVQLRFLRHFNNT